MENISWELALKPGYYTIIVQYTTINFRPGNNRLPRTGYSHPGKHPLSALFRAPQVSPGESTHIPRTSVSPEVHPSVTGFREPPRKLAWLPGNSLPDSDVFPVILRFVPKYPARAGVPLRIWSLASTIRTLPNMVCGLPKQAHKSLSLQPRSLALFHVP